MPEKFELLWRQYVAPGLSVGDRQIAARFVVVQIALYRDSSVCPGHGEEAKPVIKI